MANEPQIPKFRITSSDVPLDDDKIIKMITDNVKNSQADKNGAEYQPEQEIVDKGKIRDIVANAYLYAKNNLGKVLLGILGGTVVIAGLTYGGILISDKVEENKIEEVKDYVSVFIESHVAGREQLEKQAWDYYDGGHNFWYEYDNMVDAIIEKGNYQNPEILYLQFGRIYNGLRNEGNIDDMKIPRLYQYLRERLLKDNINIGPETFDEWLKSIGKYYDGKDNLEEMYQYYLNWFYEVQDEVEEDKGDKEIKIGDKIFVVNDDYEVVDASGIKR